MSHSQGSEGPIFFSGAAIEEDHPDAETQASVDSGYGPGGPSHASPPPYSKEDSQHELNGASLRTVRNIGGLQAPAALDLLGPMAIAGSVKAMGYLNFLGDFDVVGVVESLGPITVNGSLECKSNQILHQLECRGKSELQVDSSIDLKKKRSSLIRARLRNHLEAATGLQILGSCECDGDVKVAGRLVIKGSLKCKSLTVHGSLTVLGEGSSYDVENVLTLHGALMRTKDEFEGQSVKIS